MDTSRDSLPADSNILEMEGCHGEAGEDTFKMEDLTMSADLQWLKELYEEDSEDTGDDLVAEAIGGAKMSYAETARMFKLRRSLDQLDLYQLQEEYDVLRARAKLNACQHNIGDLTRQRVSVEDEIEREKEADNSLAVFRLRQYHGHLCQELLREEEVEAHVSMTLKALEADLCQLEVERGRLSPLRQEMEEKERSFQVVKKQKALVRLQQEKKATQRLKMQRIKDQQADMQNQEETLETQMNIEKMAANKKSSVFFKETIKWMHKQELMKEHQHRTDIQQRIQAVQTLKSNIAASKESMRVQQIRAKVNAQKKDTEERRLKELIQAKGIKYVYQMKQLEEFQQKKQEFEERHESKRVELEAKIFREGQRVMRMKKRQPLPPLPALESKARGKILQMLDPKPPPANEERLRVNTREFSDDSSSCSESSNSETLRDPGDEDPEPDDSESLLEPEFPGLWDASLYTQPINPQAKESLFGAPRAKVLPQAAKQVLMPAKRVVCGKEEKGPSFVSTPRLILFKDFEVGKRYKTKVTLINTSYTINSCILRGVSEQLLDVISISFKPAQSMNAGMSCNMLVVFEPKINKDLEGEVQFISATASFSVPVKCTIKKCDLEVDCRCVDFGTHVVGQTISRTITLTNRGALGTTFSLDTSPSPTGEQTQSLSCTQQESSSQNKLCDSHKSLTSETTRELPSIQELSVASQKGQAVAETSELQMGDETDDSDSEPGHFYLGKPREGEIGPFDSIKLEIVYAPTIPGATTFTFHITFSNLTCKPIQIRAKGLAANVPVWLAEPIMDLKICMFDLLYQKEMLVHSTGSTDLTLTFEVGHEMQNHMKIVPTTAILQAKSSLKARLKFLPRSTLAEDANMFYDKDTKLLEVPMVVRVAGQVRPIPFTVFALVTTSDLELDRAQVDFGYCSIYESVRTNVHLTNHSLLPQDFGFIGVPEILDIQPNDGFGTLRPLETVEIILIFSPKKAEDYHCKLICKSGINRDFPLWCRGVGVQPPLKLSHSVVTFGATVVGGQSTVRLHVLYSPTSKRGAPVGARMFSFAPPDHSEISIIPSSGRLLPGERCLVQVTFRPRLSGEEMRNEEEGPLCDATLLRQQELERTHAESAENTERETRTDASTEHISPQSEKKPVIAEEPLPKPGLERHYKGRVSLLRSFTNRYKHHLIPCFVSDGDPPADNPLAQPPWSPRNNLYLEVKCTTIKPPLVVTSNNGQCSIDFNQVAVGHKEIKTLTFQNIANESLDLTSSILDLNGPFCLLNALRSIASGQSHTLHLSFMPTLGKKYREILEVRNPKMTLNVTLCGEGVESAISCSPAGGMLNFGYVLPGQDASQVLKLQNSSKVEMHFKVLLASLTQVSSQAGTELLLYHPYTKIQPIVGPQNHDGSCVFTVTPTEGDISPGMSQDITVIFQPDHPSVNYADRLTVELPNKDTVCMMDLKGAASSSTVYLCGGEPLAVPIQSPQLPLLAFLREKEAGSKPVPPMSERDKKCVLLTLRADCSEVPIQPATGMLEVGHILTTQPDQKNCEFQWDNSEVLRERGFTIRPSSGLVEAGQTRSITVTWIPPCGLKPLEVVDACATLTLKGKQTEVYNVIMMALVSTTSD